MSRSSHAVEATLLHILATENHLTYRQAARLCHVSLSAIRRAALRLEALGLLARTALPDAPASEHPPHPRTPHRLTLAGDDRILLFDLAAPSTPTFCLLTTHARCCGMGSIPYNPTLPPTDTLIALVRRAAGLCAALQADQPGHPSRPPHPVLLLPESPHGASGTLPPFADIATHPHRYAACFDALGTDRAPLPVEWTVALAAVLPTLALPPNTRSLLYLGVSPTPQAHLLLRPHPSAPFALSVCGAPLTDTLTRYLQAAAPSASLGDRLAPLCRFLTDLTVFCRPDTVLLEAPPVTPDITGALRAVLPPATHLLTVPSEPHRLTLAARGALLLALDRWWTERLASVT